MFELLHGANRAFLGPGGPISYRLSFPAVWQAAATLVRGSSVMIRDADQPGRSPTFQPEARERGAGMVTGPSLVRVLE